MGQNARKQSQVLLFIFAIVGLVSLLFLNLTRRKKSPQSVIYNILWELGISPQTIKFWTAVSALETAGWTSRVFKDSNNLFCIIVPGSSRLPYGEGQTIFATIEDSVYGLYNRVMKPFKYPAHVESLRDLVRFMKSKNYFTSDETKYFEGASMWYNKLYPND